MQSLKIGQSVEIVAVTNVEWNCDHQREAVRTTFKPFKAVIVGQRRKQVGVGSSGYYDSLWSEGWQPGEFKVKGTLLLWECRISMQNKPVLVADEDLNPIRAFSLPERRELPVRVGEKGYWL